MSDELTRDLTIRLHWDDHASGPAKAFHNAEKERIKNTAREQEKADADYVRATKLKLRAEKDLADEIGRRFKDRERAQQKEEQDYIRAVKAKVRAEAQLDKEKERALVKQEREQERANNAYVRATMQRLKAEAQLEEEHARRQKELFGGVKQVGMAVGVAIGGAFTQAMHDASESIREARDYIKGMMSEMESVRSGSREIAALRGEKPTAGFAAKIAREAASVGLSPEQYQEAALGFEAHAGQYVGGEETGDRAKDTQALEKAGKRITRDQSLRLQKQIAGYAVGARGLGADDAMRLLGTVIAKSKAGSTDDEIMGQYAKILKVAELAPGRTTPIIGQIAELGMESAGPAGDFKSLEQAAYLIRVMAQRNPNEASTYGRASLRGLREIRQDPAKMAELGITKDMDVFGQIQAVDKAVKAHVAKGGDQGEFLSKYFKDIRDWGGMQTAINEGIRGGGFRRAENEAAGVNAETARKETVRYLGSEEGRAAKDRSEETAVGHERAAHYVGLRHMQSEARKALISSGRMELPEGMVDSFLTRRGEAWAQGGRFEQEERAEVGRMLRERLLGSHEGRRWLIDHGGPAGAGWYQATERQRAERSGQAIFNRATPENTLGDAAALLDRIQKTLEHQNRLIEQDMKQNGTRPMPNARPPMAVGNGPRMGG